MVLVVLMGMVAFAVDYGWLFWNGIKIQHGADAAALSGVIYEPDNRALAHSEAQASALENGYNNASASTQVTPLDFMDDPSAVENPFQLSVAISHEVPTFFMNVFGFSSVTITKRAVAEYILPLELGSPSNQFGNAPSCTGQSGGGECPGIWASIQGDINGRGYGDKYSSKCENWDTNVTECDDPESNPTYRERGYIFGIDVPDESTSGPRIRLFDPGFNPDGNGASPIFDRWSAGGSTGHTVQFKLYAPTPTPLDLASTTPIASCKKSYGPGTWDDDAAQAWETLCNAPNLGPGVYPLQVRITSSGTVGHNRFSIRTFADGANSTVYAMGDFSLYSTQSPGDAEFYLARIGPEHSGKTLVLNLWDVGDATAGAWVQPLAPGGATYPCSWEGFKGTDGTSWGVDVDGNTSTCRINTTFASGTTTSRYNNSDLKIEIDLTGYTCSADCWWKIKIHYSSGGTITDTTTWEAHIEGNPVKLVE